MNTNILRFTTKALSINKFINPCNLVLIYLISQYQTLSMMCYSMCTCFLAEYFLLQHNYRHVSQITITRVLCFVLFSFLPSQKINLFSTEFNKDWTKIYYFFYCFPIGQNWTIGQSIFKLRYITSSSPKNDYFSW